MDCTATDQGGRRRQRGAGDICGVFSAGTEAGGTPGRWMTKKGKKTRETQRTLHVSSLEVKDGDYRGGTGTATYMQSLWDAYASGLAD